MVWTLTRVARDLGLTMSEAANRIGMHELMHWHTFYEIEAGAIMGEPVQQPQPRQQTDREMRTLLAQALGGVPVSEHGTPMV